MPERSQNSQRARKRPDTTGAPARSSRETEKSKTPAVVYLLASEEDEERHNIQSSGHCKTHWEAPVLLCLRSVPRDEETGKRYSSLRTPSRVERECGAFDYGDL